MPSLGRKLLDMLMPKGSAWNLKVGGDLDNFQEGLGDSIEYVREDLDLLSEVRNPQTTGVLSDLEKEFGITTVTNVSEPVRRTRLAAQKYPNIRNGSIDHLQQELDNAGFNLQVHSNSPAVDPALFLSQFFQMYAGNTGAGNYAGNTDAYAGAIGGELLVNGDIVSQSPAYLMQAGGTLTAGNTNAVAGYFTGITQTIFQYDIPTDPADWPMVFFVGGDATRDGSGALTSISQGLVPFERKEELKRTILSVKPNHSWCGLLITYT